MTKRPLREYDPNQPATAANYVDGDDLAAAADEAEVARMLEPRFVCDEDTHYWPELPAERVYPPVGTVCRCGERRWGFPKSVSPEENAAFLAEIEAEAAKITDDPNYDPDEGLRRWLS